jgi:methyltransferase
VTLYVALILAVALERVAELVLSKRHIDWARARGGVESGFGHYPFMVVLHTGLLVACLVEARYREFEPALGWPMLALVVLAQGLRWWCIATLGPRWNTRVVVVPGLELVRRGPYRWLRHPNYVAVVVEGVALPLVHSAWNTAVVFTVLNAGLLTVRIRCENRALAAAAGPAGVSGAGPVSPAEAGRAS